MPRDKNTEPFELPEDLPSLTEKQQAFVLGILAGKSATQAYRDAYDCRSMSANAIGVEACRLKLHPSVSLYLDAFELAGQARFIEDAQEARRDHVQRMLALQKKCEKTGNMGAAVAALHHAGKAQGVYVERLEYQERGTATADLVELIQTALGPDAARKAAVRLGLDLPESDIQGASDSSIISDGRVSH